MINHQKNNSANDGDEQAVQIQAGDAGRSELLKEKASDKSPDDAENDVQKNTFSRFVDEFAPDETGKQAQNDPRKNRHCCFSLD